MEGRSPRWGLTGCFGFLSRGSRWSPLAIVASPVGAGFLWGIFWL